MTCNIICIEYKIYKIGLPPTIDHHSRNCLYFQQVPVVELTECNDEVEPRTFKQNLQIFSFVNITSTPSSTSTVPSRLIPRPPPIVLLVTHPTFPIKHVKTQGNVKSKNATCFVYTFINYNIIFVINKTIYPTLTIHLTLLLKLSINFFSESHYSKYLFWK